MIPDSCFSFPISCFNHCVTLNLFQCLIIFTYLIMKLVQHDVATPCLYFKSWFMILISYLSFLNSCFNHRVTLNLFQCLIIYTCVILKLVQHDVATPCLHFKSWIIINNSWFSFLNSCFNHCVTLNLFQCPIILLMWYWN